MEHSLLSRFQGALVGAACGELLGWRYQAAARATPESPVLRFGLNGLALTDFNADRSELPSGGWGRVVVQQCNTFLMPRSQQYTFDPPINQPQDWAAGMGLVVLPLALYWHEDWTALQLQIEALMSRMNPPQQAMVDRGALLSAWGISHLLQHPFDPVTGCDRWIEWAAVYGEAAPGVELQRLQELVGQNSSLKSVAKTLHQLAETSSTSTIATMAALYSFLRTPNDARLTVLQTAALGCWPSISCAIAGALAGAYHGLSSWPLQWRSQLSQPALQDWLNSLWGVASEEDILHLAGCLLASWAGMDATNLPKASTSTVPISLPVVAAPRSS